MHRFSSRHLKHREYESICPQLTSPRFVNTIDSVRFSALEVKQEYLSADGFRYESPLEYRQLY